ncbi:hypothetical protein [Helicobacter sp. MIT 05-5294]|nr:hypothetical protein [Helicobacter sp. MIT 05-5294]
MSIYFINSMIKGKKCDYSTHYFYIKGDYIYSKTTQKIVDIKFLGKD